MTDHTLPGALAVSCTGDERDSANGTTTLTNRWRTLAPTSFKELSGALLSVVLVGAFLVALIVAVQKIGSDPRTVPTGNSTSTVDEWLRSKDLLAIVLPLLGAVVSFWLGVAIEGRRADEHRTSAQRASAGLEQARTRERQMTAMISGELGNLSGQLRHMASFQPPDGTDIGAATKSDLEAMAQQLENTGLRIQT